MLLSERNLLLNLAAKIFKFIHSPSKKKYGYLTFNDASVATISVAPIHLVVLYTFPPSCSQPCLSKPFSQAASISCCIFGIEGIRALPVKHAEFYYCWESELSKGRSFLYEIYLPFLPLKCCILKKELIHWEVSNFLEELSYRQIKSHLDDSYMCIKKSCYFLLD